MRSPKSAPRRVIIGAVIAASVSACNFNTKEAAETIKGRLKSDGWDIDSVTCPDNVKMKKGENFKCTGTFTDKQTLDIAVTQTDSMGSIEWKTQSVALLSKIEEQYKKDHTDAKVDCGGKHELILDEGVKIPCTVQWGDVKVEINVENNGETGWKSTVR